MNTVEVGDMIKIIKMDGEPAYSGREGIVEMIDDAGQIHGTWGGLALLAEKDEYKIVKSSLKNERQ